MVFQMWCTIGPQLLIETFCASVMPIFANRIIIPVNRWLCMIDRVVLAGVWGWVIVWRRRSAVCAVAVSGRSLVGLTER